jgi:hypothetical protein
LNSNICLKWVAQAGRPFFMPWCRYALRIRRQRLQPGNAVGDPALGLWRYRAQASTDLPH